MSFSQISDSRFDCNFKNRAFSCSLAFSFCIRETLRSTISMSLSKSSLSIDSASRLGSGAE